MTASAHRLTFALEESATELTCVREPIAWRALHAWVHSAHVMHGCTLPSACSMHGCTLHTACTGAHCAAHAACMGVGPVG